MAFRIFLKLQAPAGSPSTTFKGDSIVKGHENEIEVESFSWGESKDGALPDAHEMAFVTPMSSASPNLARFCAEGGAIPFGEVSVTSAGAVQAEVLAIKIESIQVGSYQLGTAAADPVLADRFTLGFRSMDVTKRVQRQDGSIGAEVTAHLEFPTEQTGA